MKYYILERGEDLNRNTLHVFDDALARAIKTCELIYGYPPDELDAESLDGWKKQEEELDEDGRTDFEGDPNLEWFTAFSKWD